MEIPTTPAELYALISRVNLSTTTEFLQEVWKALPSNPGGGFLEMALELAICIHPLVDVDLAYQILESRPRCKGHLRNNPHLALHLLETAGDARTPEQKAQGAKRSQKESAVNNLFLAAPRHKDLSTFGLALRVLAHGSDWFTPETFLQGLYSLTHEELRMLALLLALRTETSDRRSLLRSYKALAPYLGTEDVRSLPGAHILEIAEDALLRIAASPDPLIQKEVRPILEERGVNPWTRPAFLKALAESLRRGEIPPEWGVPNISDQSVLQDFYTAVIIFCGKKGFLDMALHNPDDLGRNPTILAALQHFYLEDALKHLLSGEPVTKEVLEAFLTYYRIAFEKPAPLPTGEREW